MAVTTQKSTQLTNLDATPPVLEESADYAGRLRVAYFAFTQSGAGDATSSAEIARLPPGRVTLLGRLSNIEHNWTTASATMDVGWDAYTDPDGVAVAASSVGLDDGIAVDTAGETTIGSAVAAGRKQFDSKTGVSIRLTSQDVALADADTAEGYLIYVVD
jgi:hypothetical protein